MERLTEGRILSARDEQAFVRKEMSVVTADQAGFHLPVEDARIPAHIRLLRLPPCRPERDPVEPFGGLLKASFGNRL